MAMATCPFCGGEAFLSTDPEAVKDMQGRLWAYTMVCSRCCATSGLCWSKEQASEAWNRRVAETPDANKCGLECIRTNVERVCVKPEKGQCPRCEQLVGESLEHIQQLEASYSQVSKALCGKENATLDEVLQAISQVKSELEAVKRERDAAVSELPHNCWNCKYHLDKPIEETDDFGRTIHRYCEADCCYPDEENSSWEWRGVCPENTEVQDNA